MRLNLAGALLAGSIWLLATVLAWAADHPTAAVLLLCAQIVFYGVVAIWEGAARTPSLRVRVRERRQR